MFKIRQRHPPQPLYRVAKQRPLLTTPVTAFFGKGISRRVSPLLPAPAHQLVSFDPAQASTLNTLPQSTQRWLWLPGGPSLLQQLNFSCFFDHRCFWESWPAGLDPTIHVQNFTIHLQKSHPLPPQCVRFLTQCTLKRTLVQCEFLSENRMLLEKTINS